MTEMQKWVTAWKSQNCVKTVVYSMHSVLLTAQTSISNNKPVSDALGLSMCTALVSNM